jgi:Gpi18-like mannosyltransferase
MCAFLMMPTGILNSAYWGQCDMIYVAFILLGLCYYCQGHAERALWLTAVAFAFKMQALFIVPFYVFMWLRPYQTAGGERREVKPVHFLPLPIPYLLFTIPGIAMGRDAWNSIGVYIEQADAYYPWLTLNYPNIYAFFGQTYLLGPQIAELGRSGLWATMMALGALAYFIYVKKLRMNANMMVTTALFSVCLLLYGLPYMHERYGILIDVLAIVYAVLRPRRIPVALGLVASSLMSYMLFLFGRESMPPLYHSLLQLTLITMVGMDFYRQANLRPRPLPAENDKPECLRLAENSNSEHENPVLQPAQAELVSAVPGDARDDGIEDGENGHG